MIKATLHGLCVKNHFRSFLTYIYAFFPLEQLVDYKSGLNYQVSHVSALLYSVVRLLRNLVCYQNKNLFTFLFFGRRTT